jgi:predicted short-subunit dehydrogenase-like oxidoreductase (DUF2520 family)
MLRLIGEGRMGGSLARAARAGDLEVSISGRGFDPDRLAGDEVLICVPDGSIREVADRIGSASMPPRLVGHTSGATGLEAISGAGASDGTFSIHPLQTVPDSETSLHGAPAAIAGSTPEAAGFAEVLASALGLEPFAVPEAERPLYHAAASISSNFLIALEETAAELMLAAGVERPRETLAPLVRRTVDNWVERGSVALTGPVARGDEATLAVHRSALEAARPDLVAFYDCMVDRTASVARSSASPSRSQGKPS